MRNSPQVHQRHSHTTHRRLKDPPRLVESLGRNESRSKRFIILYSRIKDLSKPIFMVCKISSTLHKATCSLLFTLVRCQVGIVRFRLHNQLESALIGKLGARAQCVGDGARLRFFAGLRTTTFGPARA